MASHGIEVEAEADAEGWRFRLSRRGGLFSKAGVITHGAWTADSFPDVPGVALLRVLLEDGQAEPDGDAVRLSHDSVAGLTAAEVMRLGLPPVCTHGLFLEREAPIGTPQFRVRATWTARDGLALAGVRRQGTLLTSGTRRFLLLDPIRALMDALDVLNAAAEAAPDDLDRRMTAFAAFRSRLTEATGDVQSDEYLCGLVIHHATGIGIDVMARQGEEFFTPILYGDRAETRDALEDIPSKEVLLPRLYANQFAGDRFPRQGARSHYVVGRGVYVVLDPPVVAALSVVERVNRSDRATRAAFRQDPMAHLMPELEKAGGDGSSICDLKDYGERVLGIGLWEQAKLSFRVPVSRQWFPENDAEVFTLELGGPEPLVVRREKVADLKRAMEEAEAAGRPTFEFGGREHPLSPAAADAVRNLAACVAPEPKEPGAEGGALEGPRLTAAITANNEEDLTFNATLRSARRHLQAEVDAIPVLNRPMKHQRDGIQWLQTAFLSGMPGVLLADDMGLGKTFQVLAFMRWLRDGMRTGGVRRPFLVVAPKTLLGTWASEIDGHLGPGALGRELRVCESRLAALKVMKGRGSDIVLGTQTLDVGKIEDADLVLTTYETLRDYHLSFGKVRFAVVVFDEAQKLKNPTSLMNTGAKAQQADFSIIMTGTPIENGVIDLWTILDITWPGFLSLSAKEFVKRYGECDSARREELKAKLVEPVDVKGSAMKPIKLQPVMLRRFKTDILADLPERRIETMRETMPEAQARAYDAILGMMGERSMPALQALQALRTVSLHPDLTVPGDVRDQEAFVAASARVRVLMRILDGVAERGEKTLIFVDLLEAQRALSVVLAERYCLRRPPAVINGSTAGEARDRIRCDFQNRSPGFDVLLLGPKAAGFGLTLTAANHVVHLNRWWNPAVEDQCSDRVYRIGQKRPVTVWLPQAVHPRLGEKSYDLLLHGLLEEKRTLSREIVVPTQFTELDFRRLYEQVVGRGDGDEPPRPFAVAPAITSPASSAPGP